MGERGSFEDNPSGEGVEGGEDWKKELKWANRKYSKAAVS
jgi:hypothetical protein